MSAILRALAAREWGKRRRITLLRHGAVSYYQACLLYTSDAADE